MTNKIHIYFSRLSTTNLFLLLCLVSLISSAQKLTFSHLGLDEGLPQETIHCIDEDINGFIWLGTSDGVVRYDGHAFFTPQPDSSSGLDIAGYRIGAILTNDNDIHIGTGQHGLLRYNTLDESISHIGETNTNCTRIIKHKNLVIAAYYNSGLVIVDGANYYYLNDSLDKLPLRITGITTFENKLYVGTHDGHIYSASLTNVMDSGIDLNFKLLTKLDTNITNLKTINDEILVASTNGIYKLNHKTSEIAMIPVVKDKNLINLHINTLTFKNDIYYLGTSSGLYIAKYSNDSLIISNHYKANKKYDSSTINSDTINELFIANNLLFIGNINLDITAIETQNVFEQPTNDFSLDDPSVFAVYDTKDYLFIGSSSGLIISNNNDKSQFKLIDSHNRIRGITRDTKNNVWFVNHKGVFVIPLQNLDIHNPKIIAVPIDASDNSKLPSENIRHIFKDKSGDIWVTTFNAGFCKFIGNVANSDFSFKNYSSNELASVFTLSMVEDHNNNYWMSTQKGLSKLNFEADQLIAIKNYDESNGLATRGVLSSFIDTDNTLWVASRKGLNKYNSETDSFTSYGKREGLSNTFVYNINEDDLGNLWLSTNGGLFKFNKTTEEFTNYNPKDGVQSTEFNLGATFKNESNGYLYFGGINGLNIFNPHRIGELDQEGNIKFTSLKIKDHYMSPGISDALSTSIVNSKSLNLNYNDFPVNIDFSALDFRPNSNIKYVYKLLPDDKEWNTLNSKHSIQLLNLSSKSYTLQIQGKSRNDLWQKHPLELHINVTPPWYKSNVAYLIYLALFLSLVYTFYRISLQRQIAGQESKRLQDLDNLKSRFITNITHEFRTPLTIILGYIGNLKERFSDTEDVNTSLNTIEQNSNNLLNLVNQMLDLAKLEKGRLNLNLIQNDIVAFSNHIVAGFLSIATDKHISIHFNTNQDEIMMDFDAEKMRQILTNMISNALKFSPENSELKISVNKLNPTTLQIQITDEGFGISEDALPHIFDRFYQVENNEHSVSQGTGIGLALTKELVELCNGIITVESKLDIGTSFTITLPITTSAPKEHITLSDHQIPLGTVVPQLNETISDDDSNTVLIVEDNADMARYIASCLQPDYKVSYAINGKEGLTLAETTIPDIVITDVMMPVMDGFQLTQKLQANTNTNHIPIVMLTSKAMQEDKLEGITSGADAYLTKPFQKEELRLRIHMLIAKRKQLQERYSVKTIVETTKHKKEASDKNIIFLNKVIEGIHTHLDDSKFGATELAQFMAMSDSQLYRKLKAVSNTSTAIFIRKVRLEKGKELLKTTDLSVSEIAYSTGFNDPNWFSKAFKDEFEQSPSEFRN
ncbi:hybrid sensor histidine kinase/response regulator transcription factor [Psychroserpens algicola]|uniref:hybrid sensor histidine kinase/response regulator transcription factor n=1 Tax=Psychroserpens algicola TaxID=1719034 RepID=UPI001954FE6E|nr:hybrid sensor histidine kinase/response regulator transcription factor [Psychroserpens algicola]